jgi:DNA primase
MKGLCPFHEERSPSFHVRPQVGFYHCFGCGEGGDVFTFLQKMDHVSFSEAVERMAARIGFELHYEDGGTATDHGNRARILAANQAAADFYISQLKSPEAEPARKFLGERGFNISAAERFGIGFAPRGGALGKTLTSLGYTEDELVTAGLLGRGDRGDVYDRFRGRLIWPIRDATGATLGFGARKLLDDDSGPKYLNTPETPVYHKSQVLYGLDLAKRDISRGRQVVVVEGYTDVMACHLAGVGNAVATCGTAFGADHVGVLRRILLDDGRAGVVFTFDGDAAGQRAALRAYGTDAKFLASTYVAVEPAGLDPADLRLQQGDQAVRDLVARRVPLFEFALRAAVAGIDIGTAEGRSAGARAAAPILAGIKDSVVREDYIRTVAGWLGLPERSVAAQLAGPGRPARADQRRAPAAQAPPGLERDALRAVLQAPAEAGQWLHAVEPSAFEVPVYREIFEVVAAVGPPAPDEAEPVWTARLLAALPAGTAAALTRALAVEPLPVSSAAAQDVGRYTVSLLARLLDRDAAGRQDALAAQLSRPDARADEVLRRGLQEQYRALGDLRAQLQPAIRAEAVS